VSRPRCPARQLGQCVLGARQRQGNPAGGLRPTLTQAALRRAGQLRAAGRGKGGSGCGWLDAGAMAPGGVLVVAGAGFQAAVQDADQAVAELAQRGVVSFAAGA
jgi:hypothetical protein